jgi:penicillin-binding protein 2
MLRDIRKNKIFSRRTMILGAGQAALGGVLMMRLGYLQLWKHKKYSIQADSNRIKPVIRPAPRGTIFDRYGEKLTSNESNFRLLVYLDRKKNSEKAVEQLAKIISLSEKEKEVFLSKIRNARRKSVVSLVDNLGYDDLARIETYSHDLPGISIESGTIRRYPYPYETAHFLGYVSLPSESEADNKQQTLFLHPDFRVGKSGLERSFDESLRGKYGVKYMEVDVHEVPIRTLSKDPTKEGSRINTTIDLELQKFAVQKVKDLVASTVVMDVKTGEVLSYVSSPSFDPNKFVEGVSREYWKELIEDPRKPLNNKPIAAIYPPGSTFKTMVAIAALEEKFNPEERVYCDGSYRLGRRNFHCWKEGGHGSLNMSDALKNSCNIYFFHVSNQIGYDKISEVSRRFGYGEKIDVSLYGANSGLIPSPEWKQNVLKEPWVGGDTLNASIGQGNVLATPLQMALVTARIANGGVPIQPYLVRNRNIYTQFDALKKSPLVKAEHLKIISEGMSRVMNEKGGTAFYKRIRKKGYEMSGKTGTSQVISKRERDMTAAEKKSSANHAIFVGFAPNHDPKYAVSVVVEHGGSGSRVAAPIGRDLLMKVQGLKVS